MPIALPNEKSKTIAFIMQLALREITPEVGDKFRQWVPALPAKPIEALNGEHRIEITEEYLTAIKKEFDRYMGDLADRGYSYTRPIIVAHDVEQYILDMEGYLKPLDNGRRSGDILGVEVRQWDPKDPANPDSPNTVPTLFLLCDWREDAWDAIQKGKLGHVSIHVLPDYLDKQTGIKYGPFLWELSETIVPVIKDFDLQSTIDPNVVESLGLALSDDTTPTKDLKMNEEEIRALVAGMIKPLVEEVIVPLEQRVGALEGTAAADDGDEEETVAASDEDDVPAPQTPAPAPQAPAAPTQAPAPVAASDAFTADDVRRIVAEETAKAVSVALSETENSHKKRLDGYMRSLGKPTTEPGTAGAPAAPSIALSEEDAWAQAEKELGADVKPSEVATLARKLMAKAS